MFQKKKLNKISDYGRTLPIGVPSHIYGVLSNKKRNIVFSEVIIGVLKSIYTFYVKKYVPYIDHFYNSDLAVGGIVLNVSLMYEPIRNHHLIQKYFVDDTEESNLENQCVDKDVPYILFNMLTESQSHKEDEDVILENNFVSGDDHVREDVEVDTVVAHGGGVNNYGEKRKFSSKGKKDHTVEDMEKTIETLCEDRVGIFLGCVVKKNVYKLFSKGSQSIYDAQTKINPHEDKYFDPINHDVEQVINKTRNIKLSTEEEGNFYDVKIFVTIIHMGVIKLILKQSCIQKLKPDHVDVKSTFLDRYLNVEVSQDASNYVIEKDGVIKKNDYMEVNIDTSNYVTEKDGVIKKNDYVEVSMDASTNINNVEGVNVEYNENLRIVHSYVEDIVLCRILVKMSKHFIQ